MAELEVIIDGRPAKRGADVVVRSLNSIQTSAAKTDRGLKKTTKSLRDTGRAAGNLRGVLGGIGAVLVARQVQKYADAWTGLQNRLKLVTDGTENLAVVTEEVFQIAQRTRGGLAETADLYSRIARSSDTLNVSQRELLDVTESINQAIAISGSTTASANAAIIQLGQGLAAGALRGQELMSVMEQTPRLSRALADGLGVPIGQLRAMGEAGEITAEKVIKAIQDQSEALNKEFGGTSATIAQSFTILENSIIKAIGQFSDATGAAGGFADIIIDLAGFIEKDFTPGLLEFGDNLSIAFEEIGKGADQAARNFEDMGIDISVVTDAISQGLISLPRTLVNAFSIVTTEMGGFFATIAADLESRINVDKQRFAALFGNEEDLARLKAEGLALQENEVEVEKELERQRVALGDSIISQEKRIQDAIENRAAARGKSDAAELDRKNKIEAGLIASPAQIKEAAKLLKSLQTPLEEFQAQIASIERLQKAGELTTEQFNMAIQRTAEEYSAGLPEVKKWNESIEEAAELTEELQTPEEAHIARISRFGQLLDDGLISWETYNRALKDSATTMQENDPVWAAQEERMERVKELTEEVQTPLEEYNARLAELATLEDDIDPEVFIRLKNAALEAFEEATVAADPFLQKLESIGESAAQGIEGAFTDFLIDPTKDGFEEMGAVFARVLQKMAAEALSAQILQGIFGGMAGASGSGGGLGGLFASGLSAFAAAADGGTFPGGSPVLVGEEGPEVIVPGRQSTIIPNEQSAAMLQPQAPPVVNVSPQIINVQDPQAAVAAIESSGGQQAIINAISQNPDAIKRALS